MLAIIHCLIKWRHYLKGRQVEIITDHKSLEYIQTQPHVTERQTRWIGRLAEYNYTIKHRPGKTNVVADALSRRPDHMNALYLLAINRQTRRPKSKNPSPSPSPASSDPLAMDREQVKQASSRLPRQMLPTRGHYNGPRTTPGVPPS